LKQIKDLNDEVSRLNQDKLQLETKLDDLNDSIKKFEHEIMSVNGQLSDKIKLVKELQVEKSRQQEISKKI